MSADAAYLANLPPGTLSAASGVPIIALNSTAHPLDDYAWTHSAPVEGLFVLLTAVAVPIAILRWSRRLHGLWRRWEHEGAPLSDKEV